LLNDATIQYNIIHPITLCKRCNDTVNKWVSWHFPLNNTRCRNSECDLCVYICIYLTFTRFIGMYSKRVSFSSIKSISCTNWFFADFLFETQQLLLLYLLFFVITSPLRRIITIYHHIAEGPFVRRSIFFNPKFIMSILMISLWCLILWNLFREKG